MAGQIWMRRFRKRHFQLILRYLKGYCLFRATSFNKHNFNSYYGNQIFYQKQCTRCSISPIVKAGLRKLLKDDKRKARKPLKRLKKSLERKNLRRNPISKALKPKKNIDASNRTIKKKEALKAVMHCTNHELESVIVRDLAECIAMIKERKTNEI